MVNVIYSDGVAQVPENINDAFFANSKLKGPKSAEEEFFADGKPKAKVPLSENKLSAQKEVDGAVIAAVKKVDLLSAYLKSSFGLSKGQYPHKMQF